MARKLGRVGVWLAAYVGACLLFTWVRDGSLLVAVLAIFAIVGTAQRLHAVARHELEASHLSPGRRVVASLVLPKAGIVLAVIGWPGGRFFGIAIAYSGIGLFVDQLRRDPGFRAKWPFILGGSGALTFVGLVILALFGSGWGAAIAGFGILFAPVGVSLLSEDRIRWLGGNGGRWEWRLVILGIVAFGGSLAALHWLGVSAEYLPAIGGVIFVLVAAIAARSNADVVLVIAMAAIVWVLAQRAVPLPDSLSPQPGATVAVALGDSYMSGEGADQFYEGTNTHHVLACRRAPTAYPALLTLEHDSLIPGDVYFKACSGDRIEGVMRQLDEFDARRDENQWIVKFALIDGGGNDALFGDIGRTCLLPGDCSELGQAWRANLENVEDDLVALYTEAGAVLGSRVHVVPYPIPIRKEPCPGSTFTKHEHAFLHDFTAMLDVIVQRAAAEADLEYVRTMTTALGRGDGRICDGPPGEVGVNFLAANGVNGTLEQSVNPLNWFHNSLHPNARGHELMRGAVVQWIDTHVDRTPAEPPSPELEAGLFSTPLGDECMGNAGKDLVSCGYRWALKKTGALLLTKGVFGLTLPLGAWLLAVPMIRRWRWFFGTEDAAA